MTYITGFHAMEELVQSGRARQAVLLVAKAGPRIKKIMAACEKAGIKQRSISQDELTALAEDHRGAALAVEESRDTKRVDLHTWLSGAAPKNAFVIILDHIEDPHNVGAILRSADVFGVDLVILPERRAAQETDTVARTSAGASAWVPVSTVNNIVRAVDMLKAADFWVYAADMGGASIHEAALGGRCAVVMGGEGKGVSRLAKERCDGVISIPQYGHVDSLNVSVAAGIIMFAARGARGG